jgi:hypothetical protein
MGNEVRDGERSLTGIWSGLYTYLDGRSTSFVATLIDNAGSLSGTTHEPVSGGLGTTLYAGLVGCRGGSSVSFTKTYDRPDLFHQSPIVYEGILNGDSSEIEGRWTIVRVWSGKFLMVRSPAREVKAARKIFERV